MIDFIKPVDFTAKLISKKQLTEDVWEYDFQMDNNAMPYQSGHFLMVKFPHEGKEEQRAYSISSAARPNGFELCVKLIPNGKGSTYLSQLEPGADVTCKGPFGMFIIKPDNQSDLLLVATGTGIAPIKGIIEDLLSKNDQRQIKLIFGIRYPEDAFYEDLFAELAAKHSNFHFTLTCSRPDGDENHTPAQTWNGATGRVTDHLAGLDLANFHMYICGSTAMVKSVRDFGIEQGMDKKAIHVENFG